jgi:hypothetical protein
MNDMSILDKLIEKKDILAYIKFRRLHLHLDIKMLQCKALPKEEKTLGLKQLNGRIKELDNLKKCINYNIKEESKDECSRWKNLKEKRHKGIYKDFVQENHIDGIYAIFKDGTKIKMYTKYLAVTKAWKKYTLNLIKERKDYDPNIECEIVDCNANPKKKDK